MPRPNILYIHSHDTGRYVQPYGYAIPTPGIQRLAEEGVLFRQAFCAGPTCSPSRAALLTGMCPHSAGMIGLAHRGFHLRDFSRHIVHTLKRAGYTTVLAGVQHVAKSAGDIGYDTVMPRGAGARPAEQAAAEFLRSRPAQPFFLDVGFIETHRLSPPQDGYFTSPGPSGDARYVRPPAPLPDTPETRRDMADFIAAAGILDRKMSVVLGALGEAGLAGNTLVICTTDHGIAFPQMKCNLTDHGLGVMLIMRGPGGFDGGKVCDAMVSHIDVFPTVCALADIEAPPWLQGRSLLPLVRGEVQRINDEIFGEVTYHAAYEPMRAVRTERWKYIRRFDGRRRRVMPNTDDGLSRKLWLRHGWRDMPIAEEYLFDLMFDPNEAHNLAGDPTYGDVLMDMRARLERWMVRTDDPLLRGPVPAPAGARVNDVDGLSPYEPEKTL